MAPRISSYTGPSKATTAQGSFGVSDDPIGRNLSYERILADQGVQRDSATGLPFRWVDEAAPNGISRKRKHFVAMSALEAQTNSRAGQCWDFYVVGARCTHGCDRPMSGWTHRGRKFVNEHHHVTDIPRDEVWEEVDDLAADPVAVEV